MTSLIMKWNAELNCVGEMNKWTMESPRQKKGHVWNKWATKDHAMKCWKGREKRESSVKRETQETNGEMCDAWCRMKLSSEEADAYIICHQPSVPPFFSSSLIIVYRLDSLLFRSITNYRKFRNQLCMHRLLSSNTAGIALQLQKLHAGVISGI